ncbi:MAG: FKBP-type peptidyl-prolyl cis-trans isomerase [Bdellovibrionota bacterium]
MKAQIVSFRCILKNKLGQVLSSSVNNDVINQLEEGTENLKGLVAGLQDVKKGEKRQIFVPADQAYGLYDPGLVVEVPRNQLARGSHLELGNEIVTRSTADGRVRTFRVVDAVEDCVVLDGNHPLAGQDLTFEVEITAAREVSAEDLFESQAGRSHKYVH